MSKNWQLGFLGFFGIKGIMGLINGDYLEVLWIIWFIWFVYFIPKKKEENKNQQKFNSVERDRFEEV